MKTKKPRYFRWRLSSQCQLPSPVGHIEANTFFYLVNPGKLSLLPGNLPFWLSNQVDRLRKAPICTHSIPFYPEKLWMARFRLFAWPEVHAAPTCALR